MTADIAQAFLLLLFVGLLPNEIWRWAGVAIGHRLADGSPVFRWVKLVASALVAGLVARLMLSPAGLLAETPLLLRLAAIAGGAAFYLAAKRSIAAGILGGEAVLVGGIYALGIDL